MIRLTRWMVRRFLPGELLIKAETPIDEWKAFLKPILDMNNCHIARNPAKGADRKRRQKGGENGNDNNDRE